MSSTATVQLGLLLRAVVWLAVLCCALAPAAVSGNDHSVSSSASRRWVVLDTDIGGDDDDTWALALLLQSTEIDLRMVLTDSHNAEARAKIVAKTLEGAGRTNITVGIGRPWKTELGCGNMCGWSASYNLSHYPGRVAADGVGAFIELVTAAAKARRVVTLIVIAPCPNVLEFLQRAPLLARHVQVFAMSGSIYSGYTNAAPPSNEYNVAAFPEAGQAMYSAIWAAPITTAPLDTSHVMRIAGQHYQQLLSCSNPVVLLSLEATMFWANHGGLTKSYTLDDTPGCGTPCTTTTGKPGCGHYKLVGSTNTCINSTANHCTPTGPAGCHVYNADVETKWLNDPVAAYLALQLHREFIIIERHNVTVTGNGATVIVPRATSSDRNTTGVVDTAVSWADTRGKKQYQPSPDFFDWLIGRLCATADPQSISRRKPVKVDDDLLSESELAATPAGYDVTFSPNQLAANVWYRVNGSVINGHIEGSFSQLGLWQELAQSLSAHRGAFGMNAAEISHVSDRTLRAFLQAGLGLSAEDPTFTQCRDGKELGELSLFGQHAQLFCSIFMICPPGRMGASGIGWYQSSSSTSVAPDELTFDERMPNLIPRPIHLEQLWNDSLPDWKARKAAAFVDGCPTAASFNPGVDRVTGLIHDYVEFIDVATDRFGVNKLPDFAVHWNVIAWWEWADVECLEDLALQLPASADFQHAVQYLTHPCHRDTEHLAALVTAMCDHGTCPSTIYHDIDFIYNTPYAIDVLRRNKQMLHDLNVSTSFGIDLVDICGNDLDCVIKVDSTGDHLVRSIAQGRHDPNILQELTLLTVARFLQQKGIIDASTRLRLQSWSARPREQGAEVSERINGSMAHAATAVLRELRLDSASSVV
jgi:inosine-uridine nucleoside N-ribohydrolase